MISVRRIGIGEGELFKRMRLVSLRESPSAFASTYESALSRSQKSWCEQADGTAQGSDRATFIAFADDLPIGIAALYRDNAKMDLGEVLQVWVAPEYRSKGVALDIMDAVFQWAGVNGFRTIIATVKKGNKRAFRFYQKYGFNLAAGASFDGPDDPILTKEISRTSACAGRNFRARRPRQRSG
jgi:RimJ/RimL family protein N-acetyltransferase